MGKRIRCPVTELAAFPTPEPKAGGEEGFLRHKTKENILEISFDRKADTATEKEGKAGMVAVC